MPKFAIYYIPEEEDPLYQFGSQILGYDVRKEKEIPFHKDFDQFSGGQLSKYVGKARKFGFHITIGDAIDFEEDKLAAIKDKLSELIDIFNPNHEWVFKLKYAEIIKNIKLKARGLCLLQYQENAAIKGFHSLVCLELNTMGIGSVYSHKMDNPKWKPYHVQKIKHFFAPYILEDYSPHFTFMNPISNHGNNERLLNWLNAELVKRENIQQLSVKTICLMIQDEENGYWRIEQEFMR